MKLIIAALVVGGLLIALIMFLFSTDNYHLIPLIKDYQKERILSFLYPDQYSDTFFQQKNSIMAIGSGGFFRPQEHSTSFHGPGPIPLRPFSRQMPLQAPKG